MKMATKNASNEWITFVGVDENWSRVEQVTHCVDIAVKPLI